MEKFSAVTFLNVVRTTSRLVEYAQHPGATYGTEGDVEQLRDWADSLWKDCDGLGLKMCSKAAKRLRDDAGNITISEVRARMEDVEQRIIDEMEEETFFHVPAKKAEYFGKPNLFGDEVAKAFPSATLGIEEAGNCYALGRNMACVFHLQGVMQTALHTLGQAIGTPTTDNRTWDAILNKVDPELRKGFTDKSDFYKQHEQFVAEAATLLRGVKIAWRNPTMHVENVYDPDKALDVLLAVKAFMRHLAGELGEKQDLVRQVRGSYS